MQLFILQVSMDCSHQVDEDRSHPTTSVADGKFKYDVKTLTIELWFCAAE